MTTTTTDPRRARAIQIAATARIAREGDAWTVPSQSLSGRYTVTMAEAETARCTCPDHELRQLPCKHIFAVEMVIKRETAPDGTMTETRATRITYRQDWSAYNAAQTTEKEHFCRLLHDLCSTVPSPEPGRGRPRLPLSDMLFAAAFKVYSTVSARRFMTDLRGAAEQGLIARTPHFNSVLNVLDSEELTPTLYGLIEASSAPLREVETDFAIDSTGFGTCLRFNYFDAKYGKTMTRTD